jgi:hypothetical protein
VAIFTASSNSRAQVLCHALVQAGVEAYVTEDESLVGLWMGETLPGIHSPKVWVEREEAPRAAAILEELQRREDELRQSAAEGGEELEVTCSACQSTARFPASQRGSVQVCPHCGAYLDVGEDDPGEWQDGIDGEDAPERPASE